MFFTFIQVYNCKFVVTKNLTYNIETLIKVKISELSP